MSDDSNKRPTELPVLAQLGSEGMLPMDRRQAIKVMAIAAATAPAVASCAPEASIDTTSASNSTLVSNPKAMGTLWDPDLVRPVVPWERILTSDEPVSYTHLTLPTKA